MNKPNSSRPLQTVFGQVCEIGPPSAKHSPWIRKVRRTPRFRTELRSCLAGLLETALRFPRDVVLTLPGGRENQMRVVVGVVVLLVAELTLPRSLVAGGRLEQARAEIRESPTADPARKPSLSWLTETDDCEDDGSSSLSDELATGFGELVGTGVLGAVTMPWWGPRLMLDDVGDELLLNEFPFANDQPGFFVPDDLSAGIAKSWSVRWLSEYASDFDGVRKYGGRLRFDTASRFGLDTEWGHRVEEIIRGQDSLWTGDANVVYRFAQGPRGAYYTGLGLNWSADRGQGDIGVNVTYGVDFFPVEPFVLSVSMDWGRLGNASLFHGRATVGAMLDRVELFTGFDYLNLEGAGLPSFVGGVQITF